METDFVSAMILGLCLVGVYFTADGIVGLLNGPSKGPVIKLVIGLLCLAIAFYGRF